MLLNSLILSIFSVLDHYTATDVHKEVRLMIFSMAALLAFKSFHAFDLKRLAYL
jgi:hypothetical protein